jgi:O-antigen/teichoic acid export membrane protein
VKQRNVFLSGLGKIPPHLWVALSNWFSRAGAVAAQLVCLPLLSTLLTPSEFAAYAITVSLMSWYKLTDLGFGNGAQNQIAEARARGEEVGTTIAAASLLGGAVLIAALVLLVPLSGVLDHALLGPLRLPASSQTRLVLWLSGLLLVGAALGSIAEKMLYALGKGVYANLLGLLNSLAFLLLLWGLARHAEPSQRLLACVLSYTLPLGVTGISTLAWLAARRARWDWPAVKSRFTSLGVRAWRFWLFALLAAAVLNVDYLIMSRTLKAEEIATYNVLFRVYWVGMSLYSGLLTATWPVFSAMGVRKDHAGIARHIRLYLLAGLGGLLIGSVGMAAALPMIVHWLAPGLPIQVSILTLALFSAYIALRIWTDTYAVALQALSEVGIFLKVVPVQAMISIAAQWTLSQAYGINGILMGLILSYVFTVVWLLPWKLKRHCYAHLSMVATSP